MSTQISKKQKFPEQFEDSEAFGSEVGEAANPGYEDDGQPIQLIRIRSSGKVEVDEKALEIISSCDLPVGFVTVAGKYRTGKSFLLNKLLYLEGKGFQVDPSTSACTEGIWMWSRPYYNERQGNYIFFLDSEGSQSLTKDVDNDTKIFVLASLISSYFIYNSVGSIDEKSISELNVVTKLSMNVLAEDNISTRDNEDILYRFMPKFMWILRDFTLELRNRQSPKEYLEDSLTEQNSLVRMDEDARKTRRALLNYFKERDCMTLVRPAREERDLQKLNDLPEHALRRQFVEGINSLREKIMREAGPKTYEGTALFGTSIASMIESYVESINSTGFPTIKTAWEHISDDEGAFAYNRALEVYNNEYEENFSEDEPKGEEIHKILMNLRDNTITEFNRNLSQPNEAYLNKLRQFIGEKQEAILNVNKQLNDCKNVDILKECATGMLLKIEANQYSKNPEQINRDIEGVVADYKKKAKGQNKGEILSEFLTNMNPIILEIQKPKAPEEDHTKEIMKQEYEKKMKLMEQKMKSLEAQAQAAERAAQMQKRENQVGQGMRNDGKNPKNGEKKKSSGCCGGDGCSLM